MKYSGSHQEASPSAQRVNNWYGDEWEVKAPCSCWNNGWAFASESCRLTRLRQNADREFSFCGVEFLRAQVASQ